MNDVFDAIFGYYMVTLGAGAFSGVRASLRTSPAAAGVGASGSAGTDSAPGSGDAPFARGHRIGNRAARRARAARRDGSAAAVAGWVSGVRVYRAGRSGGRQAGLAYARRTGRILPDATDGLQPVGAQPETPVTPASAPEPAPYSDTLKPDSGVIAWDPTGLDDDSPEGPDITNVLFPDPEPYEASTPVAGKPRLTLVPPLKEYPPMPSADITDLESLVGFTTQAAGFAGMESEDAIAASASTIAAAEFTGETTQRIGDEMQAIEMAIAAMTVLNVDAETTGAYQRLHEAGGAYRDLAAQVAAGCQDLAALAQNMSQAASNYHEAAVSALDTVQAQQMPHAEAAMATGHGGADGQFYGVASTQGGALPATAVGALPTGN